MLVRCILFAELLGPHAAGGGVQPARGERGGAGGVRGARLAGPRARRRLRAGARHQAARHARTPLLAHDPRALAPHHVVRMCTTPPPRTVLPHSEQCYKC